MTGDFSLVSTGRRMVMSDFEARGDSESFETVESAESEGIAPLDLLPALNSSCRIGS